MSFSSTDNKAKSIILGTSGNEAEVTASNALKVDNSAVTQPVSGPLTDAELRATSVDVNITGGAVSGTEYTDGQVAPANPVGGTITFDDAGTMRAVSDTNPLPVSATISTAGLATEAKQDTQITALNSIDAKLTNPVPVTGPLTDAQLRATPVPISGTVTATPSGTQDVNITGDAVGLATELTLQTVDGNVKAPQRIEDDPHTTGDAGVFVLGVRNDDATADMTDADGDYSPLAVDRKGRVYVSQKSTDVWNVSLPNEGQQTMANSISVAIASDQSAVPVSGPLTDAELRASAVPVSMASAPLPTGAATETTLAAVKTAVETIDNAISGSEMQVDVVAPLPAGTNYIGKTRLTDGTTDAEVVPLPGYNAQAVAIVDGSGAQITSFGGGTQYNDGAARGSATGTLMMGDDGVNIQSMKVDANGEPQVDVLSVIPGTGATNLGKAEDAGHSTGDVGVMPLGVSNEGGTALVGSNLDYTPIATDKMGQIYVNPENVKVLFRGRTGSFRTPGRAGTAGQKILAIHNATGSSLTVNVKNITVDMWCTVVKAVTVAPPIVRIWKFTAVPTNGTNLTKNKTGGTTTSNASVTVWGDASADGTGSATTLTVTLPAGTIVDQLVCPRVITAVGEIDTNPMKFEYKSGIQLAPLEGICVFLDYTLATQNPTTDMWVASVEWEEFTT